MLCQHCKKNTATYNRVEDIVSGRFEHGPAPIPEEGQWIQAKEIKDIKGLTHGIGWGGPPQAVYDLQEQLAHGGVNRVAHKVCVQGLQNRLVGQNFRSHSGGVGPWQNDRLY